MKSLERIRRSADLDQRNLEQLNHGTAEFSWDDLSKVPFRGNQQNERIYSKEEAAESIEEMKAMIDSLPSDADDDENKRAAAAREEARRQALFDKMQDVGSFGRGYRNNKRSAAPTEEQPTDEDDSNKSLSDISETF